MKTILLQKSRPDVWAQINQRNEWNSIEHRSFVMAGESPPWIRRGASARRADVGVV